MVVKRFMSLTVLAGCLLAGAPAFAEPSLAERRAITAYEQGAYVEQLKAIRAAAGYELPLDVQWNTIALPDQSANYAQDGFWTQIYFEPLQKALSAIAVDDMGKQALKAKLSKVVVRFDDASAPYNAYQDGVAFDSGVLDLNFRPFTNMSDVDARADAIRKALEAKL
ncbi:hypothetical protein [Metapseudomonas otitidis]|uniref:hypothetical protein n=1 Tax=Metapseudomonas otitidis TaxID=319939 RepID=UPI0013F5C34C|nr:hypothetical protein [Pseudomonas otitidis]